MTVHFGDGTSQTSAASSITAALVCKAWVNFEGQGSVFIRDSNGVNSITDNGTGSYNVNFPSMGDANYCTVGSHNIQSVNNRCWGTDNSNYTATTCRVTIEDPNQQYNSGSSRQDNDRICLAFFT
tara:strand:- start:3013 stop:3387 length:375 start_codon:yes stop_codon:yes gene_type:complete